MVWLPNAEKSLATLTKYQQTNIRIYGQTDRQTSCDSIQCMLCIATHGKSYSTE